MEINATGRADISAVLAQMRAMRDGIAQVQPGSTVPEQAGVANTKSTEFAGLLKSAVNSVNSLQQTASKSSEAFVQGTESNLVKVMIDSQKATVGFQAMVQVRNRMVTAYQDIMKMPI